MVVVDRANVPPAFLKVNWESPAVPSDRASWGAVDEERVRGNMREVVVPMETICPVGEMM